jgi:hypothetical protein
MLDRLLKGAPVKKQEGGPAERTPVLGYLQSAVSDRPHSQMDKLLFEYEMSNIQPEWGTMRAYQEPYDPAKEWGEGMMPLGAGLIKSVAKKVPEIAKMIKKSGVKSPLYHFTSGKRASEILEQGTIKGKSKFPGYKGGTRTYPFSEGSVAMTRDPAFITRPHHHVSTDISFITDRPYLKRKGYKIKPFSEKGYEKTNVGWEEGWKRSGQMNPSFEFEERIKGNLPLEDIKMINISNLLGDYWQRAGLLSGLEKSKIPLMFSKTARSQLKSWLKKTDQPNYSPQYIKERTELLESLLKYPSYKNPFKGGGSTSKIDAYNAMLGYQEGGPAERAPLLAYMQPAVQDETAHDNINELMFENELEQQPQYSMRTEPEPWQPRPEDALPIGGMLRGGKGALAMLKHSYGPYAKQSAHYRDILDKKLMNILKKYEGQTRGRSIEKSLGTRAGQESTQEAMETDFIIQKLKGKI